MPEFETWKFINSFSPWLSAAGTTASAIVALYLARRSSMVKLRVTTGIYRLIAEGQRFSNGIGHLQIEATNVGFREAKIQGILWKTGFLRRQKYVQIPPRDPHSTKLPSKLEYGDKATFLFPLASLPVDGEPIFQRLATCRWPRFSVRYVRAGVYTSTGEQYLATIGKDVQKWFLAAIAQRTA